jgi:putative ABC transport system permease protein
MLYSSNLLLAYRNFKRSKSIFFINLLGLSTGLASVLLIYLWASDELQMDKFHQHDANLFQVMERVENDEQIVQPFTPGPLAEMLKDEIPEIEYSVTVSDPNWFSPFAITADTINVKAIGLYTGKDFFNMFSFPLLHGNENAVLANKNSIAISERLAAKLFKSADNIIGKTITFEHDKDFQITGVFKDVPHNSTLKFDFIIPFENLGRFKSWDDNGPRTYVLLKKGSQPESTDRKISDLVKSRSSQSGVSLFLRQFSNAYLYDKYENGIQAGGRIEYVKLFSAVAAFILIVACANFMNLSTARASKRLKEIGIKKTVGADRRSLIMQYLTESVLMAFIALFFSLVLVQSLLPSFNAITNKNLSLEFNYQFILAIGSITLITGLLAGSYPAFYLSGFKPALILKGKMIHSNMDAWLRKGLVVFQFGLSIIFLTGFVVVYQQINLIETQSPGFTKDHVIYFPREGAVKDATETFLSEMRRIPGVLNASGIGSSIIGGYYADDNIEWPGKNPDEKITFEMQPVSAELIETLGIEMKEGSSFSKETSQNQKLIFNEAAIAAMGLSDPIGKRVKVFGADWEIGGVVKDFHFRSLHEEVKPFFFMLDPGHTRYIMVRLEKGMEKLTIQKLETFYKSHNPGFILDYKFLDEDFQAQYDSELRTKALLKYSAALAVIISCLGLIGLSSFAAERRIKEIGIRKVMGSSVIAIVLLLSKDFTRLILLAIVAGLPITYFLATSWLSHFAIHIELIAWHFVGIAVAVLLISCVAIVSQVFQAASANPLRNLRSE